ncbi:MAG: alpha/beta hydrolase-fold protein [Candidatus Thorarchaeota archaeon]
MVNLKIFEIDSAYVPGPIKYDVLLPPFYDTSKKKYPLMLYLHGGGPRDDRHLPVQAPRIWDMWEKDITPEMVIVTPHCGRCFYMDYKDGSQKWESFIIEEFIPHLKNKFRVIDGADRTFIGGISMGGMGSLRMGLKYPHKFAIIIAFEPGIEPAFEWKEVKIEDKFWRPDWLLEKIFGKPFDEIYWRENNPAYIVKSNPKVIRESGIKIYIEVGTKDAFGLHRGTDFLHRVLFDNDIPHEYRLVYGADHIGISFRERLVNGFSFINRVMNPLDEPPNVAMLREMNSKMLEIARKEKQI